MAKSNWKITYYAVIAGVDETFCNIKLGNGFHIKKICSIPSFTESGSKKNDDIAKITNNNEDYRLNNNDCLTDDKVNFIVAKKEAFIECGQDELYNFYFEQFNYLDEVFFKIKLFVECPLHIRDFLLYAKLEKSSEVKNQFSPTKISRTHCVRNVNNSRYSNFVVDTKTKLTLGQLDIKALNYYIENCDVKVITPPLVNAFILFKFSFEERIEPIAFILLITALEAIFLDNDKGEKRIMLCKRIAASLEMPSDYSNTCSTVSLFYKKRNDYVHEGKNTITIADVIALREYLRKALKKYIQQGASFNKNAEILNLKKAVKADSFLDNFK